MIRQDVRRVPGVVDVRMQQVPHTPDIRVEVDRTLAETGSFEGLAGAEPFTALEAAFGARRR